jgi:hypothetical protein
MGLLYLLVYLVTLHYVYQPSHYYPAKALAFEKQRSLFARLRFLKLSPLKTNDSVILDYIPTSVSPKNQRFLYSRLHFLNFSPLKTNVYVSQPTFTMYVHSDDGHQVRWGGCKSKVFWS